MDVNSLTFLYFFLPAALTIYNLTPKKGKSAVLALISAVFLGFSMPQLFIVFALDIVILYLLSEAMFKNFENSKARKALLTFAIVINAAVILGFSLWEQTSAGFFSFGAMVISFTAVGYFVDLYKGEVSPIRSFSDFAVFLGFFGKLSRGPLIRANHIAMTPQGDKFSLSETGSGLYLFIRGLAKYVILGVPLAEIHERLAAANTAEISVTGAWLDMIVFSMMIFFDLSGFCDMARGLGRCFGMDLPKNFYFPFQSPTVSDFLDRFNMTVTGFFRHYVYDVLRNDKNSRPQFIVNTILICLLCGIWFGIRMNFIFWGLYIAAFIIIEEFFLRKVLLNIPRIFARAYTFIVTMFSMTIFSANDIFSIIPSFKAMFGIDAPLSTSEVSYIVSQNMLVLAIGAFFFVSAFSMLIVSLNKKHPAVYNVFAVLESAVLLVLITAELL